MVDCRPAAAPSHEPHSSPNGTAPAPVENHHTQLNQQSGGAGGDMCSGGVPSPGARATTPHLAYSPHYQGSMNPPMSMPVTVPYGVNPYYMVGGVGGGVGGKAPAPGLVWVPPPAPHVPPPPLHVNPHVLKSVQANGADLPMNDIPTLRYYFNLGVDCMWAAYGPPPPPRHYSPRDMAQDMQQMSLNERGAHNPDAHKHKANNNDKQPLNGKNSQRSLLGPRFNKRGNGQDGNSNPNHNQNNGRNNGNQYNGNKGPNNRSYSSRNGSPRAAGYGGAGAAPPEGEAPAPEPVLVPYIHYPPPVYPVQYYPVDAADPAMINMMGGMSYMGYDEGVEYGQYYAPPPPPPPAAYMPPPPHAHAHQPPHHTLPPVQPQPHHEHK